MMGTQGMLGGAANKFKVVSGRPRLAAIGWLRREPAMDAPAGGRRRHTPSG